MLSEFEEVCGKNVVSLQTAEKWTTVFDGGRADPIDLLRFGMLLDTGKVDALRALIEWRDTDLRTRSHRCSLSPTKQ
jgi:hypothetical protein